MDSLLVGVPREGYTAVSSVYHYAEQKPEEAWFAEWQNGRTAFIGMLEGGERSSLRRVRHSTGEESVFWGRADTLMQITNTLSMCGPSRVVGEAK